MKDEHKTKAELIKELSQLRQKITDLEASEYNSHLAEKELKSSRHEYLQKLNDSLQEVIFTVKMPERIIAYVNRSVKQVFGYEVEECIGKTTEFLYLTETEYRSFGDKLEKTMEEGRDLLHTEHQLWRKNGEVFPVEITTTFFKEDGKIIQVISVLRDITERKRQEEVLRISEARLAEAQHIAEDHLRALSHRLVRIQEEERRGIARELHDQIGQSLTVLGLLLDKAIRLPTEDVASNLREAQALVNELIGRVRELSFDLRPGMLDDLGLLPTLLWHLDRYSAKTQIKVDFKHSGLQKPFTQGVRIAAYRIVQEALTNIMRHAKANEVAVAVWVDEDVLWVRIEDNGAGFQQNALAPDVSSDLYGMYERARSLGGNLTIESKPGMGTVIIARLPLSGDIQIQEGLRE